MVKDWSEVFYYDETSPSCLRWAVDIPYRGLLGGAALKRKVGDVAGTLQKANKKSGSRWKVKYKQKAYMAHRIVYSLHHTEMSVDQVVDHRDGDATNNKIDNLRLVSQEINARNGRIRSNNKTGYTGVTYRVVNGFEYFVAGWVNANGKQGNKYFSIAKLGEELAEFLAAEYRRHQIDLLNLQGAGYTDRHGI